MNVFFFCSVDYSLSNGTVPVYTHDAGVIAAIFIALLSFFFTCLVNGLAANGPNSKLNNERSRRRRYINYRIFQ